MIAVTMLFQQLNGRALTGWSETYGVDVSSLDVNFFANVRIGFLFNLRRMMLATGVEHVGSRATLLPDQVPPPVPQPRQSLLADGQEPYHDVHGQPYYNPQLRPYDTDFAGTVYMIRARTAAVDGVVYTRKFIFSGLPDDFDTPLNRRMKPGPWTNAATAFENYITSAAQFVRLRCMDRSFNYPNKQCTTLDVTGTIFTVPLHNWADNTTVDATRFKINRGGNRPQGLYRIRVLTGDTFTLQGAIPSTGITKLGFFRKVNWLNLPLTQVLDRSFANKKRGRPFGVSVGKRSKILGVRS